MTQHAASGGTYGSRRIKQSLEKQGVVIGMYRLRRLIKANHVHAIWKRPFIHTTDSQHHLPIADNLFNRQFTQTKPNQA